VLIVLHRQANTGELICIPGADQWYEHVLVGSEWYINAKEDGVLSATTPLFTIRGRARVGQPAKDMMKEGEQWLSWSFTDETLVTGDSKTPLDKTFSPEPQPLHRFLFFLESLGYVKPSLLFHTVERKADPPRRFNVTSVETAAFEVKPADAAPKNPSLTQLGNLIPLTSIKKSSHVQVVHQLRFDKGTNKIESGFPNLFAVKPVMIKKGQLIQLV
jgi:hypothetical protein